MNQIFWSPKALRQPRKIPAADGATIRRAVSAELIDLAQARHVKALENHPHGYRLRVGKYRVLFDVIEDQPRIVRIEAVRKRDERTYQIPDHRWRRRQTIVRRRAP
jgi:mRNA-degrading endonuclease RelE of RelBE toxin-antitoxin system